MGGISKCIHKRKKRGEGILEEEPVGKIMEPMDFTEEIAEEPIEIVEEKIGVEPAAKAAFVPKSRKKERKKKQKPKNK